MSDQITSLRCKRLFEGKIALRVGMQLDISDAAQRAGLTGRTLITLDAYLSYVRAPKSYHWLGDECAMHELLKSLRAARKKQPQAIAFEFPFWVWTTTGGSMETQVVAVFPKSRWKRKYTTICTPSECRVTTSGS